MFQSFDDRAELKEMFQPVGAASQFLEIQAAFERAGCKVQRAELSPHRPLAVVALLLKRNGFSSTSDPCQLNERAIAILRQANIWFEEDHVDARLLGSRVLVSFLWKPPTVDSVRAMELDELLRLLP
jgi:hypothetical protein